MSGSPRFSVCQLGLYGTTFAEDVALCADLGLGLGVDEGKMGDAKADAIELVRNAGVPATICCPATLTLLPTDVVPGADSPSGRIAEICEGIRVLAELDPVMVFVITGPQREYTAGAARSIVVEGLRAAGDVAREVGVRLGLEVMRPSYTSDWTFVTSLDLGVELLDEVDCDLTLVYDTWHLWDSPNILELTEKYGDRVGGVQLSDWRDPTRRHDDRVLPGDGKADLKAMFSALERGGFTGWYDLEIFSSPEFEDSVWRRPAAEWVADGQQKFQRLWDERNEG